MKKAPAINLCAEIFLNWLTFDGLFLDEWTNKLTQNNEWKNESMQWMNESMDELYLSVHK